MIARRSCGRELHDLADAALLDDRVGLGADAGAEEEVGDVAQPARRLVDEVLARAVAIQPARDRDLGVAREVERRRLVGEHLRDLVLRRRNRLALGIDPHGLRPSTARRPAGASPRPRLGRRLRGASPLRRDAVERALGLGLVGVARDLERLVREPDVVERQRHLGHRRRAAGLGAREDDVFHRLAAQVLGALLAHAPADGIDDVGLAAPVRADHAGDRLADVDDRTVAERLEADDLDPLDAHVSAGEAARSPMTFGTCYHRGVRWALRSCSYLAPRLSAQRRADGRDPRANTARRSATSSCAATARRGHRASSSTS